MEDTKINSSDDMKNHGFTLNSEAEDDAALQISFAANDLAAAEELKGEVLITVNGEALPLVWFDSAYADDHETNKNANAKLSFENGVATVTVTFRDRSQYNAPINVTTPVAAALSIVGVEKAPESEQPNRPDQTDPDGAESTEEPSDGAEQPEKSFNHLVWILPTVGVIGLAVALYFVWSHKQRMAAAVASAVNPQTEPEENEAADESAEEFETAGDTNVLDTEKQTETVQESAEPVQNDTAAETEAIYEDSDVTDENSETTDENADVTVENAEVINEDVEVTESETPMAESETVEEARSEEAPASDETVDQASDDLPDEIPEEPTDSVEAPEETAADPAVEEDSSEA